MDVYEWSEKLFRVEDVMNRVTAMGELSLIKFSNLISPLVECYQRASLLSVPETEKMASGMQLCSTSCVLRPGKFHLQFISQPVPCSWSVISLLESTLYNTKCKTDSEQNSRYYGYAAILSGKEDYGA